MNHTCNICPNVCMHDNLLKQTEVK